MYTSLAVSSLIFAGCQENKSKNIQTSVDDMKTNLITPDSAVAGEPCDITISDIHFTKSINGADTLLETLSSGILEFKVGAKKDYFSDPDGKLSNNTAPIILTEIDNTKPFTFTSKVSPEFTKSGLYNAGVLYIYANESLYQKHCFEQDERGFHRVVTVRTDGTSDDSNHDVINQGFVYLKISSDTKTVASYYSLDNKNWQMVRLYKNNYPQKIWLGLSTQCPVDSGAVSYFDETKLEFKSVSDFRLGK